MKPQELNQDDQKNTNGGFLTDGLLGGNDNTGSSSHSSSGSSSATNDHEGDSSNGLLGDVPLLGNIL